MPTDSHDERLAALVRQVAEEAEKLGPVLARAVDAQWVRAPAGLGPRDLSGVRAGGRFTDPTADVATDPDRLYVRTVLRRSYRPLLAALVAVRGVRRGLELALARWQGPDEDEGALA